LDKERVKLLLELSSFPPTEVLEEIIEEQVFSIKDYLLRNPIVKALFLSRSRKLTQLAEILSFHAGSTPPDLPMAKLPNPPSELIDLLRWHEASLNSFRLSVSGTSHPALVNHLLLGMINFQKTFEDQFLLSTEHLALPRVEKIKQADQLETGPVIRMLISGKLEQVSTYLAKERSRILLIP